MTNTPNCPMCKDTGKRKAGWDENPYEVDCDHDTSEKPAPWGKPGNKDALDAVREIVFDHLNILNAYKAVAMKLEWEEYKKLFPSENCKLFQALATLDNIKATHILVAREDVPRNLENDLKVMQKPMAIHCVEMKTCVEAAALLAQKTEE